MAEISAPDVIPCLRYKDARTAIAWLERAFGFRRHAVHDGPDGGVAHAEMVCGTGMIMLGPDRDDFIKAAGVGIQCIYVVVADPDAHHARAVAAGARVVRTLNDTDYGSREYCALDIEGHFWSFGTYRPARS